MISLVFGKAVVSSVFVAVVRCVDVAAQSVLGVSALVTVHYRGTRNQPGEPVPAGGKPSTNCHSHQNYH
ncbi:hypothetical protein DPMN_139638 [Dreissena polymorpha]|uniref:Secreted protein n=1 Tax=Dreissena polymorpha TaxID=45954 RepID=A0A9D4G699_DREPO|nr:hypothetical protein DPMN_139638 [Dreissena polymorpha]